MLDKLSRRNKILIIIGLILFALAMPLTIIQVQKQQDLRQRASGEQTKLYFANGSDCSKPLESQNILLSPNKNVDLSLCLQNNSINGIGISGFNIVLLAGNNLTFISATATPDADKFGKDPSPKIEYQNKTLHFTRINISDDVPGQLLRLLDFTVTGEKENAGEDVIIETAEITSLMQDELLSVEKSTLHYTISAADDLTPTPTTTPTPTSGVTPPACIPSNPHTEGSGNNCTLVFTLGCNQCTLPSGARAPTATLAPGVTPTSTPKPSPSSTPTPTPELAPVTGCRICYTDVYSDSSCNKFDRQSAGNCASYEDTENVCYPFPGNSTRSYKRTSCSSCTCPTPTSTPTPTPTIPPGKTSANFKIALFGIVDKPQHSKRRFHIEIFDPSDKDDLGKDKRIVELKTDIDNDQSVKHFKGTNVIDAIPNSGIYNIKVKSDGYLRKLILSVRINKGVQNDIALTTLIPGDIDGDNRMNLLDYNLFVSCYGTKADKPTCNKKTVAGLGEFNLADFNDDIVVDGIDVNTFIKGLSVKEGD